MTQGASPAEAAQGGLTCVSQTAAAATAVAVAAAAAAGWVRSARLGGVDEAGGDEEKTHPPSEEGGSRNATNNTNLCMFVGFFVF